MRQHLILIIFLLGLTINGNAQDLDSSRFTLKFNIARAFFSQLEFSAERAFNSKWSWTTGITYLGTAHYMEQIRSGYNACSDIIPFPEKVDLGVGVEFGARRWYDGAAIGLLLRAQYVDFGSDYRVSECDVRITKEIDGRQLDVQLLMDICGMLYSNSGIGVEFGFLIGGRWAHMLNRDLNEKTGYAFYNSHLVDNWDPVIYPYVKAGLRIK